MHVEIKVAKDCITSGSYILLPCPGNLSKFPHPLYKTNGIHSSIVDFPLNLSSYF